MILTPGQYDTEDYVMLCYSVLAYIHEQDEIRLDLCEVARVVSLASDMLPRLVEEPQDDWDGVMWFQRLECTEPNSLASWLAWCASPDHTLDLRSTLTLWLRSNSL